MKKLKTQMLVRSIPVTAFFLIALTALLVIMNYRNTLQTLEKTMKETTQLSALQVQERLGTYKTIVAEWGTLEKLASSDVSKQDKQALLDGKKADAYFKAATMAGADGIDLYGNNIKDTDYFKAAMQGEDYVSDPIVGDDKQSAHFYISAPLWADGKKGTKIVGVLYAQMDNEFLCNTVENIKIGETGTAYLVNGEATCIAHTNRERVYTQNNALTDAKNNPALEPLASLLKRAYAGETAFDKYTFQGVTKFAVMAPVEATNNWAIAVTVSYSEYMQSSISAAIIAGVLMVVALLIVAVSMIVLTNGITKSVLELSQASTRFAEGDLNISVSHQSNDELGELAKSFKRMADTLKRIITDLSLGLNEFANGNFAVDAQEIDCYVGDYTPILVSMRKMRDTLSDTLRHINTAAEQVAIGSDQVSSGAQALASGSAEQAASIEELTASVKKIAGQAAENASIVEISAEHIEHAAANTTAGNEYMGQLTRAMEEIGSASNQIANITKVIEDIAFQTNILALNAAIEAARAGAAGKGFAVVADEVRNLAAKSGEAAKQTAELIQNSVATVKKGTEITVQTAQALQNVGVSAVKIVDGFKQIERSSAEQAGAIEQIMKGLSQISSVVQTNAATAEENSATSEEMSAQASALRQEVGRFKLAGHTAQNLSFQKSLSEAASDLGKY